MQTAAMLAELGITVYQRRSLVTRPALPIAPAVQGIPAPRPPATVSAPPTSPSTPMPDATRGRHSIALPGAQALPRLKAHLLAAWQGDEVEIASADIVFGGRGKLLALPSLGALAGNPQLKRQAWQALRALRRAEGRR